jgi:hypothetical protein
VARAALYITRFAFRTKGNTIFAAPISVYILQEVSKEKEKLTD